MRSLLARDPYAKARYAAPHFHFNKDSLQQESYHSQYGQDKYVHQTLLGSKRDGTFVDLGAFDGIALSNTYALEKNFGWTGLAVEPMPAAFENLKRNRTCHLYNGCISEYHGEVDFLANVGPTQMLSGMVKTYNQQHQSRINKENAAAHNISRVIRVPSTPLWPLLEQYDMTAIDYLTIDTKGAEYSILASLPLDRVDIDIIDVENNYNDSRIFHLLTSVGYQLVAVIGCDEIYRKA